MEFSHIPYTGTIFAEHHEFYCTLWFVQPIPNQIWIAAQLRGRKHRSLQKTLERRLKALGLSGSIPTKPPIIQPRSTEQIDYASAIFNPVDKLENVTDNYCASSFWITNIDKAIQQNVGKPRFMIPSKHLHVYYQKFVLIYWTSDEGDKFDEWNWGIVQLLTDIIVGFNDTDEPPTIVIRWLHQKKEQYRYGRPSLSGSFVAKQFNGIIFIYNTINNQANSSFYTLVLWIKHIQKQTLIHMWNGELTNMTSNQKDTWTFIQHLLKCCQQTMTNGQFLEMSLKM